MDLKEALGILQDDMATTDLLTRRSRTSGIEFLIKRHQNIKLRMDSNTNHKRPHIHIDYGTKLHVASYAIDNGERLAGNLDSKYDKNVKTWIATYHNQLFEAWEITQSGQKPEAIILKLKDSVFG